VADLVTLLHALLWDALATAVVLHLLAIGVYAMVKGHNLLLPMVTGWKWLPTDTPPPRLKGPAPALAALGAAAAITAALAWLT
jgi:hypothetical protein